MHKDLLSIIRSHVRGAVSRVDPARYRQEPAYVNAVLARIDGLVYKGIHGEIELRSTVVDDRGPNSAEKQYGADFAITAVISNGNNRVEKAVIGQAKKGRVEELSENESQRLSSQVKKMGTHTDQHVVLEVPKILGHSPIIRIPYRNRINKYKYPVTLEDYITSQLVQCLHGDRRPEFVVAVQDSKLSRLSVIVRT